MLFDNFFKKCAACKKKRFYVAKRTFYSVLLHTEITSQNMICGRCLKAYKTIK